MKRDGSIMIFVLLIFTLISTSALLTVFVATEQIEIANSTITNIQSKYLAESKINRIFYDEKYFNEQIYPALINNNVANQLFHLNKVDLMIDDNKNIIEGRFFDFQKKRYIELVATSEYKGRLVKMVSSGPVFNEIFYDDNSAISTNTININHLDKFNDYMNEISDTIVIGRFPDKSMEFYDLDSVILKDGEKKDYDILIKRFGYDEVEVGEPKDFNTRDRVFMIVKNPNSNEPSTLYIENYIDFRGILYVEGDLIINSNFRCAGIIIVKGNIIFNENLNKKPEIHGILLYNGELDLNDWNLRYNTTYINLFGPYLPNFIDPKLQTHKILEGN